MGGSCCSENESCSNLILKEQTHTLFFSFLLTSPKVIFPLTTGYATLTLGYRPSQLNVFAFVDFPSHLGLWHTHIGLSPLSPRVMAHSHRVIAPLTSGYGILTSGYRLSHLRLWHTHIGLSPLSPRVIAHSHRVIAPLTSGYGTLTSGYHPSHLGLWHTHIGLSPLSPRVMAHSHRVITPLTSGSFRMTS